MSDKRVKWEKVNQIRTEQGIFQQRAELMEADGYSDEFIREAEAEWVDELAQRLRLAEETVWSIWQERL